MGIENTIAAIAAAASATLSLAGAEEKAALWSTTIDGQGYPRAAIATAEGGVVIVGNISTRSGLEDVWIVEVDRLGGVKWQEVIGGSDNEYAHAIARTPQGGIAIAGDLPGKSRKDSQRGFVAHFSDGGKFLRTDYFPSAAGAVQLYDLAVGQDGGAFLTGRLLISDGGAKNSQTYVVRTDANGKTLWERSFGGSGEERGAKLILDGEGVVVAAEVSETIGGNRSVLLLRIDENGDVIAEQTITDSSSDVSISELVRARDGGIFLLTSASREPRPSLFERQSKISRHFPALFRLEASGAQVW